MRAVPSEAEPRGEVFQLRPDSAMVAPQATDGGLPRIVREQLANQLAQARHRLERDQRAVSETERELRDQTKALRADATPRADAIIRDCEQRLRMARGR